MHTKRTLSFLTAGISLLICATVTYAGSLTPSASPAATSYTLTDIYTRLTTNATATAGNHAFAPSGSPSATLHTLTELYNAVPTIDATKIKNGTTYLGITGSLLPNSGTATTPSVFTGATAHLTGDWNLDTGTLTLACATATFDGTANTVANAYDGAGDGTNRFCMTNSGDAVAGDILSGKIAWVDGLAVTGTMAGGYTYGSNSGYYVLGTATAPGTALVNLWNGTNTAATFPGGSQSNGGVDDYNNAGSPPSNRYAGPAGWTQCNAGNSYCGTSDSGADMKDNSTGLIWSLPCNGSACTSFSDSSPLTYSWDSSGSSGGDNGTRTASQLCSDHTGWALPHQMQFMQAYIDGSYGNLEASGVGRDYWSATTLSNFTLNAWGDNLSNGRTNYLAKTYALYVRCVRSA